MFDGNYGEKVDLWAVGVVAYQLLTGELPFINEHTRETIDLIRHGEINFLRI